MLHLKHGRKRARKTNITEELIAEIKEDFSDEKCVSVNSKEEKGNYQLQINSLEDRNNLIRCIFAVDQLNEG